MDAIVVLGSPPDRRKPTSRRHVIAPEGVSSALGRPVNAFAGLALAFVLLAQDAWAQQTAVCSDTPPAGEKIARQEPERATRPIDIDVSDVDIRTTVDREDAVKAEHKGTGNASVRVRCGRLSTTGDGSRGISAVHSNADSKGDISVHVEGGSISTTGSADTTGSRRDAHAIFV